jgi:hypothetical protein
LHILTRPKTTFFILLGWIIAGFLSNLDYNLRWGCIGFTEPVFSTQNIFFSGVSLILITAAFLIKSPTYSSIILFGELIFWGYKLFYLKGGYAVGFGGAPDVNVVFYDLAAITLRFILITQKGGIRFKAIYSVVFAFLILYVKIAFFS